MQPPASIKLSPGVPFACCLTVSPMSRKGVPASENDRLALCVFYCSARSSIAKGSRTLLEALRHLPLDVLDRSEFSIVGRPQDAKIAAQVRAAAENSSHLHFRETVRHSDALALIQEPDVMVCASSDETGRLTLIEAMPLGKAILMHQK